MKKKIYSKSQRQYKIVKNMALSMLMLSATLGFSQNAPIDFESGGKGANWTWSSFENVGNAALQFVSNPSTSGINSSSKVAKFTALTGGQPWAGCESLHGADIGKFTLSASNAIVKIMVYKSVKSDVGIKFATNSGGSTGEFKVANTKINEWEELTFDFTAKIGEATSTDIDQIVVFPDFQLTPARTTDNVCYFDNITFSSGAAIAEPTVAAPTPTKAASNVISMFSNAYTNVTVDTWRTGWSNGTLTDMQVAGNDTKKYTSLDFVGVETVVKPINATSMDSFHVDMWTPNATSFKVKLVDLGANGTIGGGDDKEHELAFTPVVKTWNHLSIPLSNFTGLTTRAAIGQLIFVGVPTGTSIVYIDNVLFSKKIASSSIANIIKPEISIFPNPPNNNLNIKSGGQIESAIIYNAMVQNPVKLTPLFQSKQTHHFQSKQTYYFQGKLPPCS